MKDTVALKKNNKIFWLGLSSTENFIQKMKPFLSSTISSAEVETTLEISVKA